MVALAAQNRSLIFLIQDSKEGLINARCYAVYAA